MIELASGAPRRDEPFVPVWLDRTRKCIDLLAQDAGASGDLGRVADLGCGGEALQQALAASGLKAEYRGFDLAPDAEDVTPLDLETSSPAWAADVVVLLGVAEHLANLGDTLARLSQRSARLVISHVIAEPEDYSDSEVQALGWLRRLTAEGMRELLAECGWTATSTAVTADGRTMLWLARRDRPAPVRDRAVLTPYPIPAALAHKRPNLGDGFILHSIERLIGPFAAEAQFSPRLAPSAEDRQAMAASGYVVLAGANQLNDNYRIWPDLTASELARSALRFVPFGVGLHGEPSACAQMSDETKAVLEVVHQRIEFSSWRCPLTTAYLSASLPHLADRFLLTGCPVIYDRPILEGRSFHDGEQVIAVTVTDRGDFWDRESELLERVAKLFPRSRKLLIVHQDFHPPGRHEALRHRFSAKDRAHENPVVRLRWLARRLGYRVLFPRDVEHAYRIFGAADVHIGSRLHAHLHMLSQNKRSFVVAIDDRARGMAELFGFPLSEADGLERRLGMDFEPVRAAVQRQYQVMERFVRSLRD